VLGLRAGQRRLPGWIVVGHASHRRAPGRQPRSSRRC
jgi:hypothetical protein